MEKLNQLEILIKHEIEKATQKQQHIKQIDPLKYQKISDVINDLEVDDIMKYIKRLYFYFEIHEYNRNIEVVQKNETDMIWKQNSIPIV